MLQKHSPQWMKYYKTTSIQRQFHPMLPYISLLFVGQRGAERKNSFKILNTHRKDTEKFMAVVCDRMRLFKLPKSYGFHPNHQFMMIQSHPTWMINVHFLPTLYHSLDIGHGDYAKEQVHAITKKKTRRVPCTVTKM